VDVAAKSGRRIETPFYWSQLGQDDPVTNGQKLHRYLYKMSLFFISTVIVKQVTHLDVWTRRASCRLTAGSAQLSGSWM
jgi:hypothetical protein